MQFVQYLKRLFTIFKFVTFFVSLEKLRKAQLFSTNAFSLNVLSTFTAIYSQSIVNTNNFFTYFIKEIKYLENDIGFIRIKPIV